ncbi:MAG: choice-of-anchor tandem repeat GloVer-containing protein [Candidatus Korobacteraceae bacterium]
MTRPKQLRSLGLARLAGMAGLFILLVAAIAAQAQAFSVLHSFTGGGDGELPIAGVTVGPSGVLYGTAAGSGNLGYGTVFKLSLVNSSWVFSPLHKFTGGSDGAYSVGGVVIGPNGALYGTTWLGGSEDYGTVFELRPPLTACKAVLCYWNETVLYNFTGSPDGGDPLYVNLAFDQAGDMYGTTSGGGYTDCYPDESSCGTVFELTPSGGGWTESIIHDFGSGTDGWSPYSGVVLDTVGNVYGTTFYGGNGGCAPTGCGTVYQLMPSNGGWVENVLVNFDGTNGDGPYSNLIMDGSGNLYGTTIGGGQNLYGVVYKLTPSDGGFTYSALYTFSSFCDSRGGVALDAAGHFFGVCYGGGAHYDGWIFELTNCSQTCTLTDLHDFSGSDGNGPWGAPVLDANGNLYGTTLYGGTGCYEGCGVVWEITPMEALRTE